MVEASSSLHEALRQATAGPALNCPSTLFTLARVRAIKAVKLRIRARGERLADFDRRTILAEAQSYLNGHPELVQEALEIVRNSPQLRKLAEREARERKRNAALFANVFN